VALPVFEQLGRAVLERWRAQNFLDAAFPDIAAAALADARLSEHLTPAAVVDWALGATDLSGQRDLAARFGDPPITVWSSDRCYIDVYFWWQGTTTIHQHAFGGAFQVLLGGSVHGVYDFELDRELGHGMRFGDLALRHVELLTAGDIRSISAGPALIHSLFHLDQPSVSVVVRTGHALLSPPQFDYRRAGVAVDPFFEDRTLTRQLQVLVMCHRSGEFDAEPKTVAMLRDADLHSAFLILATVRPMLQGTVVEKMVGVGIPAERFERLLAVVHERDRDAANRFRAVFAEVDTTTEIVRRRNFITATELRFFLALLLNVPDRDQIARLVRDRFPDADPTDKILDWIAELGTTRIVGSDLTNALGVADFSDEDVELLERVLSERAAGFRMLDSPRARALGESVLLRPLL
jgi:hypothetical protein